MEKLTIKQEISKHEIFPIVFELVSFVNETINSKNFKAIAKNFIKEKVREIKKSRNKTKIIKFLDNFSFYNFELYDQKDISNSELLTYIIYLSNIKGELLDELTHYNKGLLEKQVSPPLSAYKYVGNNKMDITYSTRSYGLLFE